MEPTLVLPRRGVFRYRDRRRTAIADTNTALLFHPDETYAISHPTDRGDDCLALGFDRTTVADALGGAGERACVWTLDARRQRLVHRAAHAALEATDASIRDESALDVLALVAGTPAVTATGRGVARIDAIRERFAVDPGATASLAEVARDAGISPFHLAHSFRAYTGTSLHQYRTALRLAAALAMLRDGADDMTSLALDLGFANPSHFSDAFRRAYGRSPRTFARAAAPAKRRRL